MRMEKWKLSNNEKGFLRLEIEEGAFLSFIPSKAHKRFSLSVEIPNFLLRRCNRRHFFPHILFNLISMKKLWNFLCSTFMLPIWFFFFLSSLSWDTLLRCVVYSQYIFIEHEPSPLPTLCWFSISRMQDEIFIISSRFYFHISWELFILLTASDVRRKKDKL